MNCWSHDKLLENLLQLYCGFKRNRKQTILTVMQKRAGTLVDHDRRNTIHVKCNVAKICLQRPVDAYSTSLRNVWRHKTAEAVDSTIAYVTATTRIEILWVSLFFRRKRHTEDVATQSTPRSTFPTIPSSCPRCIINTANATNEMCSSDTLPSRSYSFQNNTVSVTNNALMQLLFKLTIYSSMKTELGCH
jgi:hypothetical protein